MTKVQFKEAFRRGLGSAFIELKSCDSRSKYKDIVLWSCLHNTCYDMQCEGGRGIYLYEAICLFEDKSFFEAQIITHFKKKKLDTWMFDQYCDLLFQFARDGSMKARSALYEKYNTLFAILTKMRKRGIIWTERDNFEWLCVWLTSLDGFREYKKIVVQVGEYYLRAKETNTFYLDWFYGNSKNKFGEKRVDNYLRSTAVKSNAVAAFLKEIVSFETHKSGAVAVPTLEELIEASHEPSGYRSRGIALRFARTASVAELTELAQIAVEESNPTTKLVLLWPFRKKPFPLDERYIFELAENGNQSIRNIAFEMMQHLSSNRIHDYAKMLIKEENEIPNALSLLCYSYTPKDEKLLTECVKCLPVTYDDGSWHGVFMDVEDLLDKRSCKFEPSLFLHMYQQTLCSSCRARLVQSMFKRKILPYRILEECLYDSYEDTRKFAARKLKNKI